ncbi:MAG: BamA/TamA family outer membrane protein [Saprospiraceae bacterium]
MYARNYIDIIRRLTKGTSVQQFVSRIIISCCSLLLPFTNYAQQQYLQIELIEHNDKFELSDIEFTTQLPDSQSVTIELKSILTQLHNQSYLEASIDSIHIQDSIHTAFLHLGNAYEWVKLRNANVENAFLEQVGFREKLYQNRPFAYATVRELQEELLEYAENNGYPFAQVRLDSVQIDSGKVNAALWMDKGTYITVDSLKIIGDARISKAYLSNYLGLKKGIPFSKAKLLQVRDRLRELPFLQSKRDATVTFISGLAVINLYLDRKKASKFDFIVGFLPGNNAVPGQPEQRLLLTGNFEGEMYNQFGAGERIYASFEQLRPGRQELELAFTYPYLLDLPFGIDSRFELYRRDESFLDAEYDIGVQYLLEGGNYFKAFVNNSSSNLLVIDTSRLLQTQRLPDQLDISRSAFGLEYSLQKTDYRLNPRRGWSTKLRGSAGIKRIRPNNGILALSDENVDFGAQYDSLNLRSFQYRIDAEVALYIPFFKRTTLKIGNRTGAILAEEPVLANEQFRLGGNRLLRGFNEEEIQADIFSIMTLEYRLLIGQNSYFYIFGDYAYVENPLSTARRADRPFGFGGGLTFETKVGLFGMSLAWGSQLGNSVDFNAPKIHFGYISLF